MAKNENSLKNLKKFDSTQSRELAKKNGSKGGKACQEAKRKRKTQREQLELLLSLPLKNDKARQQLFDIGINEDDVNNQMAMNVAMLNLILKGGKGAVQAYNSFNTILGDLQKQKLEHDKMKQEIEILKLEKEKLKREIGGGDEEMEVMLQSIVGAMTKIRENKEHEKEEY